MAATSRFVQFFRELGRDVWLSVVILFMSRLNWLLLFGPMALVGDAISEAAPEDATVYRDFWKAIAFACSGISLIPFAERLSFVTEQVAAHTNGTIGALLNATFGNAPELLISTFALRTGKYRVVQLAMLGSMLTNLLFVFGISCLIGGLRWQVQELRITSGNVSVLMLLVATAGSLLPAALTLSGQMQHKDSASGKPSSDELQFSRLNALIMITMYLCYLMFQLGTHKEEFDEEENLVETPQNLLLMTPHYTSRHGRKRNAERNHFCLKWFGQKDTRKKGGYTGLETDEDNIEMMRPLGASLSVDKSDPGLHSSDISSSDTDEEENDNSKNSEILIGNDETSRSLQEVRSLSSTSRHRKRATAQKLNSSKDYTANTTYANTTYKNGMGSPMMNSKKSDDLIPNVNEDGIMRMPSNESSDEPQMSFIVGLFWLSIITLCISALTDILVDTMDEFSTKAHMSQVFTSMVILPFFSNVAEQVSAIIFAYRNEMDLCVGVTVGSAIQVATFVLPGSVLIGMIVDRSMTLYFKGYETCCLFLGVIFVAAILQGGTTNWLVGVQLMGVYFMLAAGFWFHELEDLARDEELDFQAGANRILS